MGNKVVLPNNAVVFRVLLRLLPTWKLMFRAPTLISKESSINEQIDRMRHAATRAILERRDVIVVQCIAFTDWVTLGPMEMTIKPKAGTEVPFEGFVKQLVELQYTRNDIGFDRGSFRVRGDVIDVFLAHLEDRA